MFLLTSLAPDPFVELAEQATASAPEPERERIARLAYALWQRRGGPTDGTAEQDWQAARMEAERERQSSDARYSEALARAEWLSREIDQCPDAE